METLLPTSLAKYAADLPESELRDLQVLAECGFAVARIIVVPPAAEAEFYRLNNLGVRLASLFRDVDTADPDDDDIDELAPLAQSLIEGHYLLDEFIDAYYDAIAALPARVRVRRPGTSGLTSTRGRPSLLSVKQTWGSDWSFESLWTRLSAGGPLLPVPRPVLVHAAPLSSFPEELSRDAGALLGRPLTILGDPRAGITRLQEAPAQ